MPPPEEETTDEEVLYVDHGNIIYHRYIYHTYHCIHISYIYTVYIYHTYIACNIIYHSVVVVAVPKKRKSSQSSHTEIAVKNMFILGNVLQVETST